MPHYELIFIGPSDRRSHPVHFRAASPESARILASHLIGNQLRGSHVGEALLSVTAPSDPSTLRWKDGVWERDGGTGAGGEGEEAP